MAKKTQDRRAIFAHLKNDELANIYFVHGTDSYMLDRAIEGITEAALPEGDNGFSFDRFRGDQFNPEVVMETCNTLPMMSRRRVVLVRDIQDADNSALEGLTSYFENPCQATCLILHAETGEKSLDGRKKWIKTLRKKAAEFELKGFYDNELPEVLVREGYRKGIALDKEAISYLITAVGAQLGDLVSAIEKVSLFVGATPGKKPFIEVGVGQTSEIVAETQVHSVFKFTEALGKRDIENACQILEMMNQSGESAIKINTMIARHFRILSKLHDPSLRGASPADRAASIGVSSYFLGDYERDARSFSPPSCSKIMQHILKTDRLLKSSGVSDLILMENLVFSICVA